jgi:hypothetical protein
MFPDQRMPATPGVVSRASSRQGSPPAGMLAVDGSQSSIVLRPPSAVQAGAALPSAGNMAQGPSLLQSMPGMQFDPSLFEEPGGWSWSPPSSSPVDGGTGPGGVPFDLSPPSSPAVPRPSPAWPSLPARLGTVELPPVPDRAFGARAPEPAPEPRIASPFSRAVPAIAVPASQAAHAPAPGREVGTQRRREVEAAPDAEAPAPARRERRVASPEPAPRGPAPTGSVPWATAALAAVLVLVVGLALVAWRNDGVLDFTSMGRMLRVTVGAEQVQLALAGEPANALEPAVDPFVVGTLRGAYQRGSGGLRLLVVTGTLTNRGRQVYRDLEVEVLVLDASGAELDRRLVPAGGRLTATEIDRLGGVADFEPAFDRVRRRVGEVSLDPGEQTVFGSVFEAPVAADGGALRYVARVVEARQRVPDTCWAPVAFVAPVAPDGSGQ